MFQIDIESNRQIAVDEIYIYDFDSTLFQSPMPNPLLWGNSAGRIINDLEWFSHIETLPPDRHDWFYSEMLQSASEALQKSNCLVLLMTGRKRDIFDNIIRQLCSKVGLNFPLVLCKEPGFENTFHFKSTVLRRLLARHGNAKVHIYDDRIGHLNQFTILLSQMNVPHVTTHVQHSQTCRLPSSIEFELVKRLIENYNQTNTGKIEIRPVVDYTCILLSSESNSLLLDKYPARSGWIQHCDHITLCLGSQPSKFLSIGSIGNHINFTATHYGYIESQAEALMVIINGEQFHITLNVAPGVKPKNSLDISNWVPITPLELHGIIQERMYHNVQKLTCLEPKLALGKLIRQVYPDLPELPVACKIVKEWILGNSITPVPENEPQILKYVSSDEFLKQMETKSQFN